jgi:hypothetical protein
MSKHGEYHRLPHGCEKRILLYENRKYARTRHSYNEYGDFTWFVESKKRPGKWRKLDRSAAGGDERDYHLIFKLVEAWKTKLTSSDSASAEEEGSAGGEHLSKFGLDRHGLEKFTTVKLKKGNTLYFFYTLKESKKTKGLHWLSFRLAGTPRRYCLDADATWKFLRRTLMGLSPKLVRKALEFTRTLHEDRKKAGKK